MLHKKMKILSFLLVLRENIIFGYEKPQNLNSCGKNCLVMNPASTTN